MDNSYIFPTVPLNSKIELYQAWLVAVNWRLGKNQLTESEIEIFSYILYYNDKYKSIVEDETRYELLFSTSVKKKIKEEFNIETTKFETYLNKLRKKGIIKDNVISKPFIVNIDDNLQITFRFALNTNQENNNVPLTTKSVEQVTNTPAPQEETFQKEEIQQEVESISTSTDPWSSFYTKESKPKISVNYNL